jgi:Zn-dependent M28 family amino/carboxypeptidase
MAANLEVQPEAMILVDMVGDADQQLYIDLNSNAELAARLWAQAARLGYGAQFVPVPKYRMLDDHIPFAERGIPAVDIIDFDYPYWHTTGDTADKVSGESLERVGRTLETYLENRDE